MFKTVWYMKLLNIVYLNRKEFKTSLIMMRSQPNYFEVVLLGCCVVVVSVFIVIVVDVVFVIVVVLDAYFVI